jgi:hypothetical protein
LAAPDGVVLEQILQVERVVFNALAKNAALSPGICALGDQLAIVLRTGRSTLRPG